MFCFKKNKEESVDRELGKTYKKGDYIFTQGDLGDCAYSVYSGEVELIVSLDDKKRRIDKVTEGELFGIPCFFGFDKRPFSARVILDNTKLLKIDHNSFMESFHTDPSLAYNMTRIIINRLLKLSNNCNCEWVDD